MLKMRGLSAGDWIHVLRLLSSAYMYPGRVLNKVWHRVGSGTPIIGVLSDVGVE